MQPQMKRKRFSKEEAESWLGRRVRLIVEFSDIPKGTSGKVVETIEIEPNGFEALVEWETAGRAKRSQQVVRIQIQQLFLFHAGKFTPSRSFRVR